MSDRDHAPGAPQTGPPARPHATRYREHFDLTRSGAASRNGRVKSVCIAKAFVSLNSSLVAASQCPYPGVPGAELPSVVESTWITVKPDQQGRPTPSGPSV